MKRRNEALGIKLYEPSQPLIFGQEFFVIDHSTTSKYLQHIVKPTFKMVNLALLLVFCASILITDTHAAPTVYPELIPGPGMPSLASLNLTSEMLYKQALASQISPPQGSSGILIHPSSKISPATNSICRPGPCFVFILLRRPLPILGRRISSQRSDVLPVPGISR